MFLWDLHVQDVLTLGSQNMGRVKQCLEILLTRDWLMRFLNPPAQNGIKGSCIWAQTREPCFSIQSFREPTKCWQQLECTGSDLGIFQCWLICSHDPTGDLQVWGLGLGGLGLVFFRLFSPQAIAVGLVRVTRVQQSQLCLAAKAN